MTRQTIDCRLAPNEAGCTLAISGEPDEVLAATAQHVVAVHGHTDGPELRDMLRNALAEEPDGVSTAGAFVQIFEFSTDRIGGWNDIQDRFVAALGPDRTTRWSILCADRDRPDTYVAIVEFPDYERAMANSENPLTAVFLKELQAISRGEPEFRNLDVRVARPY